MRFLILFLTLTAFFGWGVLATCDYTQDLNLTADAFQYEPSINPAEYDYKEWWFFTASDPVSGIAFCMGYSVDDPAEKGNGKESSGIAGMFWPDYAANFSNIIDIVNVYNLSDFTGSKENASVSIGEYNRIHPIDERTYLVEGQTFDGEISWELTYTQMVPGIREIFQVPVLLELDWISYMPSAQVDGSITYQGNKIPVHGKGYHDHNWGVWPASIFNWVWAQFGDNDLGFGLVMGSYKIPLTKDYIGYVFLLVNGTKAKIGTLCGDSYSLTPLEFQEWNGHKYSVHNQVEVKGDEWWLEMDYRMVASGPNPGGGGLNLLVFEQVSQYNVTLYQSNGSGGWNVAVQASGLGFNEWSDVVKL